MLEVKYFRDKQRIGFPSLENVGIEFHSLLLGMMAAFRLELTEKQIFQNIKTLFKQLNLPRVRGLPLIVNKNLTFLQSNELIKHQEGGYVISEKGEPLGICALKFLRQHITD